MKFPVFFLSLLSSLSVATAFTQQKLGTQHSRLSPLRPSISQLSTANKNSARLAPPRTRSFQLEPLFFFKGAEQDEKTMVVADLTAASALDEAAEKTKATELIALGIWLVSLTSFILINNYVGPFPAFMKQVPERVFFLSHMVGGMLFGGGIILTTCIERLAAESKSPPVLEFYFSKIPGLDALIVVPAVTVSIFSGIGLSIVRYGGLDIAPPHISAIFITLILFMGWWALTDLSTQTTALKAVNEMYESYQNGVENLETPEVVRNRHVSNVVSCFFVLTLYSLMVFKPGTLVAWPWAPFT
jgi:hypothetical protein